MEIKSTNVEIDPNTKDTFVEKNFFSQDIPLGERTSVFNSLFFHYKENWKSSFGLMLILSIGITSLGLSEDSPATIIGAMIITPLGQPIVALGGAIALGWRKQSFRMLGIIVIGTIISIVLASPPRFVSHEPVQEMWFVRHEPWKQKRCTGKRTKIICLFKDSKHSMGG